MSAALTLPLDADCFSSIAMLLLFRSDKDLISRRARRSATRLSGLPGDPDAVFVTRSAIPVASVTCCCIVRGPSAGAVPAAAGNAAISGLAGGAAISDLAGGDAAASDLTSGLGRSVGCNALIAAPYPGPGLRDWSSWGA